MLGSGTFPARLCWALSSNVFRLEACAPRGTSAVRTRRELMKDLFVYIMANHLRTTVYIGVTNDLARRVWEHQCGEIEGFTKEYRLTVLVYYEMFPEARAAIAREKQLKTWRRTKKDDLPTPSTKASARRCCGLTSCSTKTPRVNRRAGPGRWILAAMKTSPGCCICAIRRTPGRGNRGRRNGKTPRRHEDTKKMRMC